MSDGTGTFSITAVRVTNKAIMIRMEQQGKYFVLYFGKVKSVELTDTPVPGGGDGLKNMPDVGEVCKLCKKKVEISSIHGDAGPCGRLNVEKSKNRRVRLIIPKVAAG